MKLRQLTGKAALWMVLASLSVAASAGAFGDAGSSVTSKPLSGRVPGVAVRHPCKNFLWSGSRYRIVVGPALHAGAAGWISLLTYDVGAYPFGIGDDGGGYPTKRRPFFAVNALMGRSRAAAGDVVDYVLTGPEVVRVT